MLCAVVIGSSLSMESSFLSWVGSCVLSVRSLPWFLWGVDVDVVRPQFGAEMLVEETLERGDGGGKGSEQMLAWCRALYDGENHCGRSDGLFLASRR